MNADLPSQLERYGDVIDDAVSAFDFDGIELGQVLPVEQMSPEPPVARWRRRGWLVAAASFAFVLLVGGGIAVLSVQPDGLAPGAGDSSSVTTVAVPPTVSSTSSTTTAPATTTSIDTTTTATIAEPAPALPMEGCTDEYNAFLRGRGRACDLVEGELVTPIYGPLLDGGWFDLTELRGRPAIVLTWVASYGPSNREALAEFQILYDKWSDRIGFISVSEDLDTDARDAVEAGSYTVPVVTCFTELGPEPHAPGSGTFNELCGPFHDGSLWVWWGNQDLPSWTILDAEGSFVDIGDTTLEEIDRLLASVVADASSDAP
jgi:hypothetical protein